LKFEKFGARGAGAAAELILKEGLQISLLNVNVPEPGTAP